MQIKKYRNLLLKRDQLSIAVPLNLVENGLGFYFGLNILGITTESAFPIGLKYKCYRFSRVVVAYHPDWLQRPVFEEEPVYILGYHVLSANRADDSTRPANRVIVLWQKTDIFQLTDLLRHYATNQLDIPGSLIICAQKTGRSFRIEEVNRQRGRKGAAHNEGLFVFDAERRHGDIESIPMVDAVKYYVSLLSEGNYFRPVFESISMKGLDLGPVTVVELRIDFGAVYFFLADVLYRVDDLPIHIVVVNNVIVHNDDLPNAESKQPNERHRAEPSDSQNKRSLLLQGLLVPVLDSDLAVEMPIYILFVQVFSLFHHRRQTAIRCPLRKLQTLILIGKSVCQFRAIGVGGFYWKWVNQAYLRSVLNQAFRSNLISSTNNLPIPMGDKKEHQTVAFSGCSLSAVLISARSLGSSSRIFLFPFRSLPVSETSSCALLASGQSLINMSICRSSAHSLSFCLILSQLLILLSGVFQKVPSSVCNFFLNNCVRFFSTLPDLSTNNSLPDQAQCVFQLQVQLKHSHFDIFN